MKRTQNELDDTWETAMNIGEVEGWLAEDQGDIQFLAPPDREQQWHYEREAPDGEWKLMRGSGDTCFG